MAEDWAYIIRSHLHTYVYIHKKEKTGYGWDHQKFVHIFYVEKNLEAKRNQCLSVGVGERECWEKLYILPYKPSTKFAQFIQHHILLKSLQITEGRKYTSILKK